MGTALPHHVHVFGDGQTKINLIGTDGPPVLVWAQGMKGNEVRQEVQVVRDQQDSFLAKWREIHG